MGEVYGTRRLRGLLIYSCGAALGTRKRPKEIKTHGDADKLGAWREGNKEKKRKKENILLQLLLFAEKNVQHVE